VLSSTRRRSTNVHCVREPVSTHRFLICSVWPVRSTEYTSHVCDRCADDKPVTIQTCHRCTTRPHTCLSKCLRGCVAKPRPLCKCNRPCSRLESQKENVNFGRAFFTCRVCNFFAWE
jgi:hypothetical protein